MKPPFELNPTALARWNELLPLLSAHPWFNAQLDSVMLAHFCQVDATTRQIRDRLEEEGWTLANGNPHPLLDAYGEFEDALLEYGSSLGLTPLGRARIESNQAVADAGGRREPWENPDD